MIIRQCLFKWRVFIMKKILAFCISVMVIVIMLGLMPIHGEAEVYDSVVRLHVLANSDSEEDQALKLKVRDAVLNEVSEIFEDINCDNINDAINIIEANFDNISCVAERCIACEGYSYEVDITLGEERYPTRNYEQLAFPSGKYVSLQVKIGEGEGKNWWCVLFPPLCLSAATENSLRAEDAMINIGLTGEQYKIITESNNVKYNVRFKLLETIDEVFS